jgi:hypothetical protein
LPQFIVTPQLAQIAEVMMFDRFLINQRWVILGGTLMLFLVHVGLHLTQGTSAQSNAVMLLLGIGYCIYNSLFLTNWHHLSERLVQKVQGLRSRANLPSMPRKEVWLQQKAMTVINLAIGSLVTIGALVGIFATP